MYIREPSSNEVYEDCRKQHRFNYAANLMEVLKIALKHDPLAQVIYDDGDLWVLYKPQGQDPGDFGVRCMQVFLERNPRLIQRPE